MESPFASLRPLMTPIRREGYPFIGVFLLLSLILFWLWTPLGWLGSGADRMVRLFLSGSQADNTD